MSRINDVMISRIIARSEGKIACSITGVPGGDIKNIVISDVILVTDAEVAKTDIDLKVPKQLINTPKTECSERSYRLPVSTYAM